MKNLFENINGKIRIIAWVNFICWCIVAVCGFVFGEPSELMMVLLGIQSEGLTKFIMLIVYLVIGYISSAFLYGFAELLEINYHTECNTKDCFEKLAKILEK